MPVLNTRSGCFQQYWPSEWAVHNLPMQFFTPGSSKMEVLNTFFYDIVIT